MNLNKSSLERVFEHSAYAKRWLSARPQWQEELEREGQRALDPGVIEEILEQAKHFAQEPVVDLEIVARELRLARQRFMLRLIYRDLLDRACLGEVTQAISQFAERVLAIGIQAISQDMSLTVGRPYAEDRSPMPLMVVGMGKLGGRELNVSSDIDLVFLYEEEGDTQGGSKSISHHEWFTRLGKKLMGLLAEVQAEGFVFRVDMRLRPNGDSGPLVCSLGMLEEYFTVQGREWERYAWIKGRLVYPPEGSDQYPKRVKLLQDIVRPFVYRRYLDFGVIAAIRDLHGQIQAEAEKRSLAHPERAADIKLGRGGIREIEFLAQMFQLVRGGQDPSLRIRPTLDVLQLVVDKQLIQPQDYQALTQAYDYLRRLEHRLQYWEDAQTHHLPNDDLAQERLSRAMNHATVDEFRQTLSAHRDRVATLFANAFVLKPIDSDVDHEVADAPWNPPECYEQLKAAWSTWQGGARYRSLTDGSRRRFIQLISYSCKQIADTDWSLEKKDRVLVRMLNLLESIARRSSYLALLSEYPHITAKLIALISSSSWGTDYLIKHPHLLDDLLTGQGQYSPEEHPEVYWDQLRAEVNLMLDDVLDQGDQGERAMDILRQVHHTETFLTLLAELGIGRSEPLAIEKVSDRLSALADLILSITLQRVWPFVLKKFKLENSEPQFAIIAYGKLGGKELGYASDLDIVFLYDAPPEDQAAPEIYSFFARRLIAWLTTATPAGVLFEIDTRLRPNGVSGLLVTNLESFRRYQLREGDNAAWVWEHQALTRARYCAGDQRIGQHFEEIREAVLAQQRDTPTLKQEIRSMRLKVSEGHPNDTDSFDVKHDSGGMVDIEFVVQYLVLQHSGRYPALLGNWGNIALLKRAADAGLIANELADQVANAYRLYREYQHRARLDGAEKTRIAPADMTDVLQQARNAVKLLWQDVLET
ncbi:MAG: hypothetical protein RIS03_1347 [Pseudomonadota bacterium]